jgi:hypothetical protein
VRVAPTANPTADRCVKEQEVSCVCWHQLRCVATSLLWGAGKISSRSCMIRSGRWRHGRRAHANGDALVERLMWFRVLSPAAVRDGVELDTASRGYIGEGEVVRALDVQSTRVRRPPVCARGGLPSVLSLTRTLLPNAGWPAAGAGGPRVD